MSIVKFRNVRFFIDIGNDTVCFYVHWVYQELDHDTKISIGLRNVICDIIKYSKRKFSIVEILKNEKDFISPNLILKFSDESELNRFLMENL